LSQNARIDYSASMTLETYAISCCDPAAQADALRLLHEGLPEDQQTPLVQALDSVRGEGYTPAFSGLMVATDDAQRLQGAVWTQLTPGRTAVVWPPASANPAAEALMRATALFLNQQGVVLAQILASPDAPLGPELLAAGEFHRLADLAYLTVEAPYFPAEQPRSELQFQSHAGEHPARLGALLERTYESSLDCPALNGVRSAADVLEGYAAQGGFAADRWFFVGNDHQDMGLLILTEHSSNQSWELVYMGVVPEARGRGFGWQIVQFALWQARCAGAQRVVLAVDQTNQPALSMYGRAGFIVWDRRTVYARLGSGEAVSF